MSAYRDPLEAAQQRIRQLEQELERLRARTPRPVAHEHSHASRWMLVPLVVLVSYVLVRSPALLSLVAGLALALLALALSYQRTRWHVLRPQEAALVRTDLSQLPHWQHEGRVPRGDQSFRIAMLQAFSLSWTVHPPDAVPVIVEATLGISLEPDRTEAVWDLLDGSASAAEQARRCVEDAMNAETRFDPASAEQHERVRQRAQANCRAKGLDLVGVTFRAATDEQPA